MASEQFGNIAAMWKQQNILPCVFSKKHKSTDKMLYFLQSIRDNYHTAQHMM